MVSTKSFPGLGNEPRCCRIFLDGASLLPLTASRFDLIFRNTQMNIIFSNETKTITLVTLLVKKKSCFIN